MLSGLRDFPSTQTQPFSMLLLLLLLLLCRQRGLFQDCFALRWGTHNKVEGIPIYELLKIALYFDFYN